MARAAASGIAALCLSVLCLSLAHSAPVASIAAGAATPRLVNSFPLKDGAFASVAAPVPGSYFPGGAKGLVLTTFQAFGADAIYGVFNASALVSGARADAVQLDGGIAWPNQAEQVPQNTKGLEHFNGASVVLEAGGFFPNPGKSTGAVALGVFTSQQTKHIQISTDKKGYFYHRALWFDMDGDGLDDVVAARAYVSSTGGKDFGELLWLKQPASNPFVGAWEEHVLVTPSGPDVFFALADLDGDAKMEVIATQFFDAKELAVYFCTEALWSGCGVGGTPVSTVIIDGQLKHFFDIRMQDMNADGKTDLLVTTNMPDGTGGVYIYEVPAAADWKTAAWTRHTIATGYFPPGLIPGKGGPGSAVPFYVNVPPAASVKPGILVSGDDNGTVDCLMPNSNDPHDWTYTQTRVATGTGTIGEVVADDLNGDGYTDFVVPYYKDGKVEVYTFAPAKTHSDESSSRGGMQYS